jgi:hypothetical protein
LSGSNEVLLLAKSKTGAAEFFLGKLFQSKDVVLLGDAIEFGVQEHPLGATHRYGSFWSLEWTTGVTDEHLAILVAAIIPITHMIHAERFYAAGSAYMRKRNQEMFGDLQAQLIFSRPVWGSEEVGLVVRCVEKLEQERDDRRLILGKVYDPRYAPLTLPKRAVIADDHLMYLVGVSLPQVIVRSEYFPEVSDLHLSANWLIYVKAMCSLFDGRGVLPPSGVCHDEEGGLSVVLHDMESEIV